MELIRYFIIMLSAWMVAAQEVQPPSEPEVAPKSRIVKVQDSNIVDILVVVDNSTSMKYEQSQMAQHFPVLHSELKNLDWRLAMITTDVSSDAPKKDGRLLEFEGLEGVFVLNPLINHSVIEKSFADTIIRPSREGNANEQGIKATYRSVERDQSWLRETGELHVILVSDSNETVPLGEQLDSRNNPSLLMSFIETRYPDKKFVFHSFIVKEHDEKCLTSSNNEAYGRTYMWLSEKTNGVIASVCDKDYSPSLRAIRSKMLQKVSTVRLECEPVNGVQVVNDLGHPIPGWSLNGSVVSFDGPLPVGKNRLDYSCVL